MPECRQVQFKNDLVTARASGYVEAREAPNGAGVIGE